MSGYSVPLFDVNFGEEEAAAVSDVIRSGWISMGPKVAEFEARFASELNSKHAVALNSCTAALHLAMATFVGEGDEVILPSMTFVATANAVRYAGARPIFADIVSSENLSIDPVDVERKITTRTKVILPMHYAGFSCEMGALQQLAAEHNLNIVEDAAHAPHSTYDGKRCGTLGDIGCFSFFSNKNITCAEGGMLVTDSDTYAARARLMRSHGMTSVSYDRARGHTTSYDVVELGFNYRLDDIRAALALVQLQKLGADVDKRAKLRVLYETRLQEVDAIVVPYRGASNKSSNYIFPIVINAGGPDRRDRIRASMANRGVQTSIHYPAVHRFSIYKEGAASLPVTEHVADNEITLPFFAGMSTEQVHEVCDALERALDE